MLVPEDVKAENADESINILGIDDLTPGEIELIKNGLVILAVTTVNTTSIYPYHKEDVSHKGMYFISYDAKLWPCCFLPNSLLQTDKTTVDEIRKRIFDNYGEDFNNLYHYSADKILQQIKEKH